MDNCLCDLYEDHILQNPKVLPCGFSACLKCLQKLLEKNGKFDCKCCKQTHSIVDPDKLISNVKIANMIKNNLRVFTIELVDKLQRAVDALQSTFSNSDALMNSYFDFLKEDISTRIESLKCELDKLGEQLFKIIDEKRKKAKPRLERMNSRIYENAQNSQKFINNLKVLLNKMDINTEKLEESMYFCQDNLKELHKIDADFHTSFTNIKFRPNETKLSTAFIGELYDIETEVTAAVQENNNDINAPSAASSIITNSVFSTPNSPTLESLSAASSFVNEINDKPKTTTTAAAVLTPTIIDMTKRIEWPCGMCNIGNKELIMTDNVRNEVVVLNTDFGLIKSYKNIGDVTFTSPFGICYDEKDTIYLCDGGNHRLLIVNKSFNKVKKIVGKKGKLNGEFNFPLGVCFYTGFIYVTDHDNRRIQIFSQSGDFVKEIRLLKNPGKRNMYIKEQDLINSPWCLSVLEDTIIVLDFSESIYIYNFEGQLRHIIQDTAINSMYVSDGFLYTHSNNGTFSCYEKAKRKYEHHQYELVYKLTSEHLKSYSAFMHTFNDNMVITFGEKKYLAIINHKNLSQKI